MIPLQPDHPPQELNSWSTPHQVTQPSHPERCLQRNTQRDHSPPDQVTYGVVLFFSANHSILLATRSLVIHSVVARDSEKLIKCQRPMLFCGMDVHGHHLRNKCRVGIRLLRCTSIVCVTYNFIHGHKILFIVCVKTP